MKYIAKVPKAFVDKDNIQWLVIEPQLHNGQEVGCYLFLHKDINQPCESDLWFQSIDFAFQSAEEDFGVKKEDWVKNE